MPVLRLLLTLSLVALYASGDDTVLIVHDDYGIPHIYAHTAAGSAFGADRKSTRLNSSHEIPSRMPSSA